MATIKLELKPFKIPNFVIPVRSATTRQEGFTPTEGIPLSELDTETLNIMCEDFKKGVFEKATTTPKQSTKD